MKNIEFGNYLYELRKQNHYTQKYVAYELGISDKTVSKWETGNSKPDLDTMRLLSVLYHTSFNDIISYSSKTSLSNIHKIVLTGGPCAGKTTALNYIESYFSKRGYTVLLVSETATELMTSGLSPSICNSNYDYQKTQVLLQIEKEKIYENAAKHLNNDNVLIVCDRGIIDNKAYMKKVEFTRLLNELGSNEVLARDSYDAVFHLVSAAKGREKEYNLNHAVRSETIQEAKDLDDKIIAAWTGHSYFRVIDNSSDFDLKLKRLILEISSFLGEPEPFEIERKFIIKYPNIAYLEDLPFCNKVQIIQTYLKNINELERRVRARGFDNNYVYYLTEKRKISNLKRVEIERRISKEDYLSFLLETDNKLHTIIKTRYCIMLNNQYFEIDIYPDWEHQAILEVELRDEDEPIKIPDFINIIKEVTDDESFKNYNMAKNMPKEL